MNHYKYHSDRPAIHSLVLTWILLLPLLVFTSQVGFSFELGASNTTAGFANAGLLSPISPAEHRFLRNQFLVVYLICILVVIPLLRPIAEDVKRSPLIFFLLLLMWSSVLWSVDLKATIVASTFMTLTVILAFYLVRRFTPDELFRIVMLLGSLVVVGSLVTVLFFPRYGIQHRANDATTGAWIGIFREKNTCGIEMLFLFLPSMFVKARGKVEQLGRILYMIATLGLLIMSRNVGAWILCVSAILIIAALRILPRMTKRDASVATLVLSSTMIVVGYFVFIERASILPLFGKDSTITGRIPIWAAVSLAIAKHPWLGYGYNAFWQGLNGESGRIALAAGWPGLNYSESGFLEVWLGLGLAGVALFGAIFVRAIRDALWLLRQGASPAVEWYTVLVFLAITTAFMEGNPLGAGSLQCLFPFIAYIGLRGEVARLSAIRSERGVSTTS